MKRHDKNLITGRKSQPGKAIAMRFKLYDILENAKLWRLLEED